MSERLIMIEFDDEGSPFEIWTDGAHYDVENSKRHGLMYSHAGLSSGTVTVSGNYPRKIWLAPGVPVVDNEDQPLDLEKIGWVTLVDAPRDEDGFEIETLDELVTALEMEEVDDIVHCKICEDYMPHDSLCAHIFWHDEWGSIGGPGACETDGDYEAHKTEFLAFVRLTGCREDMILALESRTWDDTLVDAMLWQHIFLNLNHVDYSRQAEDALRDHAEEVYGGYGWFHSLVPGETEADIDRTIAWLKEPVEALAPSSADEEDICHDAC